MNANSGDEQWLTILELLPIGVWTIDQAGHVTHGNPAARAIWCAPEFTDELQGYKGWWADTGQPLAMTDWASYRAVTTGATILNEEVEIETYDGQRKVILNSAIPLRDKSRQIIGAIVVNEEITERKRAEEALRHSESRYRTIVETSQEGIWVLNSELHAAYANQRMAEMLGYTMEDILGRSVFDFIAPELHGEMMRRLTKRKQGFREVYEFRFRRRDGAELWALVSGTPTQDEHGQFTGTFGMLTDVTDHHQALAYQREFARKTIAAATEGKLIICDHKEIYQLIGRPLAYWKIRHVDDLEMIRHAIAKTALTAGMDIDRVSDFLVCISEAATNAYKHGKHGKCSLHCHDDAFFAVVADKGPGILPLHLPELAFTPGYTTGVSLGMGYKAMISLADGVYLATEQRGTVVGILMALHLPPAPQPAFPGLSDDW